MMYLMWRCSRAVSFVYEQGMGHTRSCPALGSLHSKYGPKFVVRLIDMGTMSVGHGIGAMGVIFSCL